MPRAGGRLQPLLARYEPAALAALRSAPADEPLTATVEALAPSVLEIADAEASRTRTRPRSWPKSRKESPGGQEFRRFG